MDILPYMAIVVLVALSAFFSGSEIAFASVNGIRLKRASEAGNRSAKTALYIYEHFEDALSTILIGNNLVNIASSSIATVIALDLMGQSGTLAATLVMTIILLLFGEITPKVIAKQQCNRFVMFVSFPLRLLMIVLTPIIKAVVWIVDMASKLWTKNSEDQPTVTEEELVSIIESIEDEGVIDKDRSDLLQSAMEFSDISAKEIFTPRTDMLAIDMDDDTDIIVETVLNSPYSRIPVYKDSVDNIIGVLHVGRFLKNMMDNEHVDIQSSLIDVCFIHKTMKLPEIFTRLKRRRLQMAIVTDEYGGTMGCITMEDVLEELVGEIWDESDEIVKDFVKIGDNTYRVSGDLLIEDFFEYIDIDYRDFESEYMTMGGWAIEMLNGLPSIGDIFEYNGIRITVTGLDGMRVTNLSVSTITDSGQNKMR